MPRIRVVRPRFTLNRMSALFKFYEAPAMRAVTMAASQP